MNPTPEQMLKLAQIVEPEYNWIVDKDGGVVVRVALEDRDLITRTFEPDRDPAQLMQVVFAIANKVGGWKSEERSLIQHLVAKDADGIINLAIEVLT